MTPRLFKAAEVCEATGVQSYVLRSWEKEFRSIGVQKSADSPRLYRQSDIEQVQRIKHLVFSEGLTLAGARRRLEGDGRPSDEVAPESAEVLDTLGADARSRIAFVRNGLRSILDVVSKRAGTIALADLPSNGPGAPPQRAGVRVGDPGVADQRGAVRAKPAAKRRARSTRAGSTREPSTARRRPASRGSKQTKRTAAAPKRRGGIKSRSRKRTRASA